MTKQICESLTIFIRFSNFAVFNFQNAIFHVIVCNKGECVQKTFPNEVFKMSYDVIASWMKYYYVIIAMTSPVKTKYSILLSLF